MQWQQELRRARNENPFGFDDELAYRSKRSDLEVCQITPLGDCQLHTLRCKKRNLGGDLCAQSDVVTEKKYELYVYDGDQLVGGMHFNAYKVGPAINNWLFYTVMDGQNSQTYDLAKAFLQCWKVTQLTRPLLAWDLLWVHSGYSGQIDWRSVVNRLVASVRPDVLFLAPDPYYLPDGTPAKIRKRALRALRRLYTFHLGASPLPQSDYFMYRKARRFPSPGFRPRLLSD